MKIFIYLFIKSSFKDLKKIIVHLEFNNYIQIFKHVSLSYFFFITIFHNHTICHTIILKNNIIIVQDSKI